MDNNKSELAWYSNIYIPNSLTENENEFEALLAELKLVCSNWWNRLGKQNAKAVIELNDNLYEPVQPSISLEKDKPLIITLQSDTLMLNPLDVKSHIRKDEFKVDIVIACSSKADYEKKKELIDQLSNINLERAWPILSKEKGEPFL